MRWHFSLWILLSFLFACSTKRAGQQAPNPVLLSGSKTSSPAAVESIKAPAEVRETSESTGWKGSPYFAHIQILSETVRGSGCSEEQKLVEDALGEFSGRLSDEGVLSVTGSDRVQSLLNIELRSIGFDEGRYQSSFVNGKALGRIPYKIEFSVRPNNVVLMQYLDKSAELRLDNTPVYTFTAKELRGACEITHNVNLFAENSGRYKIENP